MQTAVLLIGLFAASTTAMGQYYTNYYRTSRLLPGSSSSCDSHTCGINARCTYSEGRPVCSCFNLHMGDPLVRCERVECLIDEDCPRNRVCTANRCTDPCANVCGTNAHCTVTNHIPTCSCPEGFVGDPFSHCTYDPQAPCKTPNVCGANTKCEVINGVATCSCLPGYRGSPLAGCRHECEIDADCPNHQHCSAAFKCESPCLTQCGESAECEVVNHRAKCSCPKNWLGNPYTRCHPECSHHSECPVGKPACLYQKCTNPCEGVCGTHANCELRELTPVCSCPRDRTGDPFTYCREFTDEDLCNPNPCGINANCNPGHDNTGKKRPVCTCPFGYQGNALVNCVRGECMQNSDCADNRACIDFSCQNPCTGRECGANANCTPRNHIAVCTCNDGFRGDAIYQCNRIESGTSRAGRYYG